MRRFSAEQRQAQKRQINELYERFYCGNSELPGEGEPAKYDATDSGIQGNMGMRECHFFSSRRLEARDRAKFWPPCLLPLRRAVGRRRRAFAHGTCQEHRVR